MAPFLISRWGGDCDNDGDGDDDDEDCDRDHHLIVGVIMLLMI